MLGLRRIFDGVCDFTIGFGRGPDSGTNLLLERVLTLEHIVADMRLLHLTVLPQ